MVNLDVYEDNVELKTITPCVPTFDARDLSPIPTGSSDYNDLENKPSIEGVTLEGNKTLEELGAFSGDYNDLINKPNLFSGDYNDLTNKPSINGNTLEGYIETATELNDRLDGFEQEIADAKDEITSEGTRQVGLVSSEGTSQVSAVQTEGETQVNAVRTEGGTQITNIEQKGADVLSRIPYFAPIITDTAEGSIASFSDGADDYPMKSVVAEIVPIQSGSGDPSPDNVRPISGWSGVNVSHSGADQTNPTVYSIPFKDSQDNPITVYGGEIDAVSGEGADLKGYEEFDGSSDEAWSLNATNDVNSLFQITRAEAKLITNADTQIRTMANILKPLSLSQLLVKTVSADGAYSCSLGSVHRLFVLVPKDVATTVSAFKTWLSNNNLQFAYELDEGEPFNTTPTEIKTLKGNNNIWCDTGDISVEYPADTKLYIDKKIGEL